jgi:hypothetical protein
LGWDSRDVEREAVVERTVVVLEGRGAERREEDL